MPNENFDRSGIFCLSSEAKIVSISSKLKLTNFAYFARFTCFSKKRKRQEITLNDKTVTVNTNSIAHLQKRALFLITQQHI